MVPALCSPVRRPSAPEYRDAIKAAKLHPTDERILLQIAKGLWKTDSLERVLDDEWICKGARVSSSTFYRRLPALIAAGWVVKVGRRSGARRTNSLYRATIPQPVAPAAPPAPEPVELMDAIVVQLADVRAQMDVWTLPFAPVDASPAEWCWADPLDFYPALQGAALDVLGEFVARPGSPGRGKLLAKLKAVYDDVARRQPPDWRGEDWFAELASLCADAIRHGLDAPTPATRWSYAFAQLGRLGEDDDAYYQLKAVRRIISSPVGLSFKMKTLPAA